MRTVKVHLESIPGSPYSQSAKYEEPMKDRESHEDFDRRTWKKHCTVNRDGKVCIPSMGAKKCIDTTAYKLGHKVPGRKGATFKGFFKSGYFCNGDAVLYANGKALTPDDAKMVVIFADAQGKGGGGRVQRRFPVFEKWQCVIEFTIVDDVITPEVFETHVKAAGLINGIGRFRPENGGSNGRFRATKFEWGNLFEEVAA